MNHKLNSFDIKTIKVLFGLFLMIWTVRVTAAEKTKRNTFEEIFIWKMSDELKLSAKEEQKFSEIQKELNRKKSELNQKLQDVSLVLKKNPELNSKESSDKVAQYKKIVIQYNQLSLTEIDQMRSLLGDKKFLEYLAIKQEINSKLKSIVLGDESKKKSESEFNSNANPNKNISNPKIIEEK